MYHPVAIGFEKAYATDAQLNGWTRVSLANYIAR
jgi:hypothetical protein